MGCQFTCLSNHHKLSMISEAEVAKQLDRIESNHESSAIEEICVGTSENLDQYQQERCHAEVNVLKLSQAWKRTVETLDELTTYEIYNNKIQTSNIHIENDSTDLQYPMVSNASNEFQAKLKILVNTENSKMNTHSSCQSIQKETRGILKSPQESKFRNRKRTKQVSNSVSPHRKVSFDLKIQVKGKKSNFRMMNKSFVY